MHSGKPKCENCNGWGYYLKYINGRVERDYCVCPAGQTLRKKHDPMEKSPYLKDF